MIDSEQKYREGKMKRILNQGSEKNQNCKVDIHQNDNGLPFA